MNKISTDRAANVYLRLLEARKLLFFAVCCLCLSACVTELQVHRHSSVAISNQDVGYILDDFSDVVSLSDSPGDFACSSVYQGQLFTSDYVMDGNVGIYNGPSVINSEQDFNDVISQPGYVKVVSAINWCGDFGPNIIGCAPRPGDSFVVVRRQGSIEGILWAHEFGHTVGLTHRSDPLAVMRGTINPNNRDITAQECVSFIDKINDGSGSSSAASSRAVGAASYTLDGNTDAAPVSSPSGNATAQGSVGLVAFVRNVYPHGTPMTQLAGFANNSENSAALPVLQQMLEDSAEQAYWGNIVVALGILGDAGVAPTLIRFANEQSRNSEGLGNTTAALMALGYLANRTGELTAINYLQAAQNEQSWPADAALRRQLATAAHIGAAFSGAQMEGAASRRAPVVTSDLALELQELRQAVAAAGIVAYYRDRPSR